MASNLETVTVDARELQELRELALFNKIRRKILVWAVVWLAVASLVVGVIALFGAESILKSAVEDEIQDILGTVIQTVIAEAVQAAANASGAATNARTSVASINTQMEQLETLQFKISGNIEELHKKISTMDEKMQEFDAINRSALTRVEVEAERTTKAMNLHLTSIAVLVEKTSGNQQAVRDFQEETTKVTQDAEDERNSFNSNSRFSISIVGYENHVGEIATDLRAIGFSTGWGTLKSGSSEAEFREYLDVETGKRGIRVDESEIAIYFFPEFENVAEAVKKSMLNHPQIDSVKMVPTELSEPPELLNHLKDSGRKRIVVSITAIQ